VLHQSAPDHIGGVGPPRNHIIRADLLGTFCHIGQRRDGDLPQVGNLPQNIDFAGKVFAKAVGRRSEFFHDQHLVLQHELIMHFGRNEREFLRLAVAVKLTAFFTVRVGAGSSSSSQYTSA